MEKPEEWNSWEREEKFDYLQNLGIYPSNNGKYKGDTGDLSEFFEHLGLEEPENWNEMGKYLEEGRAELALCAHTWLPDRPT